MSYDNNQTFRTESSRMYNSKYLKSISIRCQVTGVILFGFLLTSVFLYKDSAPFNYWKVKVNTRKINLLTPDQNITCADSILNWCAENHRTPSQCSWRIGTFRNHFFTMAAMISKPFPDSLRNDSGLALVRLGDGDMMLMFGIAFGYHPHDKTSWRGGPSRLGQDLKNALRFPKYKYNSISPFYYGIYDVRRICPIHDFLTMIYQHVKYLTYANLFANSNYPATKLLQHSLIRDERKQIILIINNGTNPAKLIELREWACEILLYPDNGPSMWEDSTLREQAIGKIVATAKRYKNRLFAFSVGYLTRVLIHYAWLENPYNRYIDFGSTLDEMIKNKVTRPYQSNLKYYDDPTYIFNFNASKGKFDVTAIP